MSEYPPLQLNRVRSLLLDVVLNRLRGRRPDGWRLPRPLNHSIRLRLPQRRNNWRKCRL
jgi:hypothetical protein